MNPGLIWSIALAAVGILGIYLAGRKNLWGWAIGTGAQVLWIVFALVTQQYGFILSALAYGAVYGRNWYRWAAERGPWREPRYPWQKLTWHATGDSIATRCGRLYGNDMDTLMIELTGPAKGDGFSGPAGRGL
jgi:hypothetical protein